MSLYLLYVYPWMPFPRRVLIYLRERQIPDSLVHIVCVSDPQSGSKAPKGYPPTPKGSLPILAIPPSDATTNTIPATLDNWTLLGQSVPIITYLDTRCSTAYNMQTEHPEDALAVAKNMGYQSSASDAMATWNAVRMFGSRASASPSIPIAASESLKWVHREIAVVEKYLDPASGSDKDYGGYAARLGPGSKAGPSYGDILLYSFLDLVDDVYERFDDLTLGKGGEGKDPYGREVEKYGYYPNVREFYKLFQARESVRRDEKLGEGVPQKVKEMARTWTEGVF